jgi:hypothetical protein
MSSFPLTVQFAIAAETFMNNAGEGMGGGAADSQIATAV